MTPLWTTFPLPLVGAARPSTAACRTTVGTNSHASDSPRVCSEVWPQANLVAKRYLRSEAFLEDYICAHHAHECACAFNQMQPPKPVDYLVPNQILTLHNQNYSIERFLAGVPLGSSES